MVALLLVLLVPAPARAVERGNTLQLTLAAPAAEAERIAAVTRELLGRLDVQVELRRVERVQLADLSRRPEPGARYFARAWIALSASGGARLYLEHAASDRVLVRDVEGDANNPELLREELGHILQTAIEGLKAGEEVGAPRNDVLKEVPPDEVTAKPAPALPASTVAAAPRAHAKSLRFGPIYEVLWLGDGARVADGPGASFEAAWPIGFELSAY